MISDFLDLILKEKKTYRVKKILNISLETKIVISILDRLKMNFVETKIKNNLFIKIRNVLKLLN